MNSGETCVACLTPPGAAAIATLAVRGPDAWNAVRALFRPRSGTALPAEPAPGRFFLGRLGADLADEVVVALVRPTPVAWVEIHCHGGAQVVRFLIESLRGRGVRECAWQELERRTDTDPLCAAAVEALAEARTPRVAAILLDQYHGAFGQEVAAVRAALDEGDAERAGALLDRLARYADLGRHLTTPWRVVVAGAPNVGKSSLVNALAGFPRCVVSATPGTTRDAVTTALAVEGWPLELIDTAGLREPAGDLEARGTEIARQAAAEADLVLWVLDAAAPPVFPTHAIERLHLIVNKIDLPAAWDLDRAAEAMRICARSGQGLAELCQSVGSWLVPLPPSPGAAVPFTPALATRVEQARAHCAAGRLAEAGLALDSSGQTDLPELH